MLNLPQRKSPRLQEYDYSSAGSYFVTICVQGRHFLFGKVDDAVMHLSPAGEMIRDWWQRLGTKYSYISLADNVVMPNHFHGIIVIEEPDIVGKSLGLTHIVAEFKTMTTRAYIDGVNQLGWQAFEKKLWQRSFHDHIIRDEREMLTIQQYIAENPARWEQDKFYDVGSED